MGTKARRNELLIQVHGLIYQDPIIKACYDAADEEINALCLSVIELHRQNTLLMKSLEECMRNQTPVVVITAEDRDE